MASNPGRGLFRVQFGDGKVRWTSLARLERAWRGTSHALLLVRPPRDLSLELRHAVELERAERWSEAATTYRGIIAAWPNAARAWVNLGNVEARLDHREESERAYRSALVLSPGLSDALNNLAWLLLSGGSRLEEAEELALEATRETGPDQPVAVDTLGRVQLARGRCGDAVKTFTSALAAASAALAGRHGDLLEGLGPGGLRPHRGSSVDLLTGPRCRSHAGGEPHHPRRPPGAGATLDCSPCA
jgi:tetratricopeptide (TPR) repeat protein